MPKASVSTAPVRHELRSCPGGFVVLRRMSFGEKQYRTEIATEQALKMKGGQNRQQRRNAKNQDSELDIKLLNRKVAEFEFANLILDHNLFEDDEETIKLDFKNDPRALDKLDPQIGDEINQVIADMNNFEDDSEGNS